MSRLALLLLLSVFAFVCEAKLRAHSIRLGTNPGVALRLRKKALDSFFKNVAQLSSDYARKLPLPDVNATVSGVDIETKNIRLTHFPPPVITYQLQAPNKIVGKLHLPAVGFEGPFKAQRRVFVATQHDNGVVVFNVTDAVVNFTAELGEFDNGIPNVKQFKCHASLGPANLNVRNAKEKFAVEVLALAAKSFRPLYNSQVCAVAEKMIGTQLNRFLSKVPNVIEVNSKVSVKFQVKTVVNKDYLELQLFEKVITDTVSPHVPAAFVIPSGGNTHVGIFVSDAVLDDLLYQAYVNELIKFTVNKASPAVVYDLVRLDNAQATSLGHVAPSLVEKYGADGEVELTLKATKTPEVEFSAGKATFTAALAAELFVTTKNDSQKLREGGASVDVTGSFHVKIVNETIFGKVSVDNVVLHIDHEHGKEWETKLVDIIHQVVVHSINDQFLKKGLPMRLPFRVDFQEPHVGFAAHTLQIQTGFQYHAQASAEKN
jgi:hypothetical protein